MQLLLDTADLNAIKEIISIYPIDGLTTNPSILAASKWDLKDTFEQFRQLGRHLSLHLQTTARTAENIVEQGRALTDNFGDGFHLKIPICEEGIKAIPMAKAAGIKVTATAVFTPLQALAAAKAGADYVAPYVNRLDNICANGVAEVGNITVILRNYGYETKVLGASFKNVQQLYDLSLAGCHAVTVTPALVKAMIYHPYTDKSIELFDHDWQERFGDSHITDYL